MKSLFISICLLLGLLYGAVATAQNKKVSGNSGNSSHRTLLNQGIMYGLSTSGGDKNGGVLFSFQLSADTVYNHYSFPNDADPDIRSGAMPVGPLLKTRKGGIYGNTLTGGFPYPDMPETGYGTIYFFDTSVNSHSKIRDYDLVTGGVPYAALTEGSDGLLYGTYTENRNGIFSFDPVTRLYKPLFEFPLMSGTSRTPLFETDSLKFAGTLWSDRDTDSASIFSYDLISKSFTILFKTDFNDLHITPGGNGKLYWIQADTLFSLNTTDHSVLPVHTFSQASGKSPSVFIFSGADKKMYGTAKEGGTHGYGVIFSFDPEINHYEQLYNVTPDDVFFFDAPLMQADDKILGFAGAGIHAGIYSFDLKTRTYQKEISLNHPGSPAGKIWLSWFPSPDCIPPLITVNNNGPACEGSMVTLSASGGASYEWTGPGNFYSTLTQPAIPHVNPGHEGLYYVRVTTEDGCSAIDSTILKVLPLPSNELLVSGELSFCAGDSVQLTAAAGQHWLWNSGDTTRSVTVHSSGIYAVSITDENGCSAESDSLTVSVNEPPQKPVLIWNGSTLSASPGYQRYEWFLNEELIFNGVSNTLVPDKPGIYQVKIYDANTCSNKSSDLLVGISGNPMKLGDASIFSYPNPARSFLNIYIQNASNRTLQVQLINLRGSIPIQKVLSPGYNQIDIRNLPAGIYFLSISDGKQRSSGQLIIY